jgi:hypothetical protein
MDETEKAATSPEMEIAAAKNVYLLEYLKRFDAECPLCHYNLRNLTESRCPECGKAIEVTVGLAEHTVMPYTLLMIAVLLPAGMGIIAWLAVLRRGYELFQHTATAELVAMVGFMMSVFVPAVPIVWRRRFLRMEVSRQWLVAWVAVVEPVVLFGLLAWGIFRD